MTDTAFVYSNLSGRPTGPFLSAMSVVSAKVRAVQAQVAPYAAAWEAHNRRAVAAEGPLWVTLGDSMAQSIGASAYDRGWAGQLADRIDPAYRHVNLSVSGGRVEDLLERQVPAMISLGTPDLVTVIIGSNDLFSRRHRGHLAERISALLPLLPQGTVIATQPGRSPFAIDFNRRLLEVQRAGRIMVCDLSDPRMRSWAGKMSPDRFHPNDLGYAQMADVMAEAVARRG